jgi:hypothetical protein
LGCPPEYIRNSGKMENPNLAAAVFCVCVWRAFIKSLRLACPAPPYYCASRLCLPNGAWFGGIWFFLVCISGACVTYALEFSGGCCRDLYTSITVHA